LQRERRRGEEADEEVDVVLVVDVVELRLSRLEGGAQRGKGDGGAGEEAKEGGAEAKK